MQTKKEKIFLGFPASSSQPNNHFLERFCIDSKTAIIEIPADDQEITLTIKEYDKQVLMS